MQCIASQGLQLNPHEPRRGARVVEARLDRGENARLLRGHSDRVV